MSTPFTVGRLIPHAQLPSPGPTLGQPRPGSQVNTPSRLVLDARQGRTTQQSYRPFLSRLHNDDADLPMLADLCPGTERAKLAASGVWSRTVRPAYLSQMVERGMANAAGLLTDRPEKPFDTTRVVFWNRPDSHPDVARLHVAATDGSNLADLLEDALPHLHSQGCARAEVRVGWDHHQLASALRNRPDWRETPLERGDVLFHRDLAPTPAPGEE